MNSLKRFNETLIDLIREMQHMLHDSEFRFYKQTAKTILLVNKNGMYNVFKEHVHNHIQKIINKDESLFTVEEFLYLMNDIFYEKVLRKCAESWKVLSSKQKDMVWLYLQILVLFHKQIQMI